MVVSLPLFHFFFLPSLFFFFPCITGAWTQGLHLDLLHQPFFVMGSFQGSVSQTLCPGWLQNAILLIFASWIARITGVSHQHLALSVILIFL
jgi:hypothetical protein